MIEHGPTPPRWAEWLAERLEAELAGIDAPLTACLATLPDEAGPDAIRGSLDELADASRRAMDLADARTLDALARGLVLLDRAHAAHDLARRRPFGTSAYEALRAAVTRRTGVPAAVDRTRGAVAPRPAEEPAGGIRVGSGSLGVGLTIGLLAAACVAAIVASLALNQALAPSRWPGFVTGLLSGSQNVPLPLLLVPALLTAAAPMLPELWRRGRGWRGRRVSRRRRATVQAWVGEVVQLLRDRLVEELDRRIEDRTTQAQRYAWFVLNGAGHLDAVTLGADCDLATGLQLHAGVWGEVAARLAPAPPGELLEGYAASSATDPALARRLTHAGADDAHRLAVAWVQAGIERTLRTCGGLPTVLAGLSDGTWQRCLRGLVGRATPGLAPLPHLDTEFVHVASVPADGDPAAHLWAQPGGAQPAVLRSARADRVDVVAVGRRSYTASELIGRTGGSGRHPQRLQQVLAELPTPEIRELALESGLMDPPADRAGPVPLRLPLRDSTAEEGTTPG